MTNIPVWLVFSVQSLIDIHFVFNKDTSCGFQELQRTGDRAIASLRNYFAFSRGIRNESWPIDGDKALLQTLTTITKWTKKDPLNEMAVSITGEQAHEG